MVWELGVGAATISGVMAYAVGAPSSQVFGPALVKVKAGANKVALTFDDGPSESTPAILDVLARHGARATFFVCGANALRLPEVLQRTTAEGHEIGNHTFHHPRLFLRHPGQILAEISETQEAIRSVNGQTPRLFRPPYGIRWFGLYPALRKQNLRAVMWSVMVYDWSRPADAIEAGLTGKTSDGAIVLLHDGDTITPGNRRAATAAALDRALPVLAQRGLRFVTISELLA